jgi:hypothetical protein
MNGNGLDAAVLKDTSDIDGIDVLRVPADAHFCCDGNGNGFDDSAGDAGEQWAIAEQGGTAIFRDDLVHWAAKVDVDEVRLLPVDDLLCRLAHSSSIRPKELNTDRVLRLIEVGVVLRAVIALEDALSRDELRDHDVGAQFFCRCCGRRHPSPRPWGPGKEGKCRDGTSEASGKVAGHVRWARFVLALPLRCSGIHALMPDEPFSSPPGDYDATSCVEVSSPDDTSAQPDVQDEISDDSSDMNSGNQNQTMPEAEEKDQRTTFNAPAESASSIESLSVMTGTISGLERLIKRSFTSPESTKVACRALIESSDDKGLWLASLVQPAHLTEELRQGCSDLSTLVIMQWVRQGETHKLKQLGDILLVEEAAKVTHESAQIMVVLAGLLGILRPLLAQRLLAAATPHMIELSDNSLVQDARRWVEAGNILEGCIPEQRVFWNRRLREPNADWDWESTEARLALSHLSGKTAGEDADLDLFQNAVPGCWWDLWCSARTGHPATASAIASSQASNHSAKSGGFWAGLLVGTAAALGFGWFAMTQLSETAAARQRWRNPSNHFQRLLLPRMKRSFWWKRMSPHRQFVNLCASSKPC